jgi:hypothetical protein
VPQLGDDQIHCSCTGVELAVPVPIAGVGAFTAALAIIRTAQGIGFHADQGANERGQQLAQHIGMGGDRSANTAGQSISWAVVIACIPSLE